MAKQLQTTSELREFLINNCMLGVRNGDIKVDAAAVIVKAASEVNKSLYSEIKAAAQAISAGKTAPALGDLKLT